MKTLLDKEDLVFNPPEPGCVLYLPGLPGGANKIHDRSPYGHTGTITGATWVRLPSGLWCLSFDGTDDYIAVSANPSLTFNGELTAELWIRPNNVTGDRTFAHGTCSGPYGHTWWMESVEGRLLCSINGQYEYGSFPVAFEIGNWYHVAMTYDKTLAAKNIKGFVNGRLWTWKDYTGDITNEGGVKIGETGDGNFDFDGLISLVKINNRPKSTLEIQNHFNREKHLFGVW